MGFFAYLRPKSNLSKLFEKYFDERERWREYADDPNILSQIVNAIRPRIWKKRKKVTLDELFELLSNEQYLNGFRGYLNILFSHKSFSKILTDSEIIQDSRFFNEFRRRIITQILPNQPDKNTLEYLLTQVFYVRKDEVWINEIDKNELQKLLDLLSVKPKFDEEKKLSPVSQMIYGTEILINRITGVATESEITKMVPELEYFENPFLALQEELICFLDLYKNNPNHVVPDNDIDFKQVLVLHKQCLDFIQKAYKNSSKYGISINVNQYLLRLQQQLDRLKDIIYIIRLKEGEKREDKQLELILYLLNIDFKKNNLIDLFNKSTQRVALEITQHKAKSGEHYITASKSEYNKMLRAAMGGGAIVGVLCVIKIFIYKLDLSPFGMAFFYSLNYAAGFILIYLMGYTLATKQPAMTASAFVKSIESGSKKTKRGQFDKFSILFARLFRSQFIAFVGNVIMAFPIALLGGLLIELLWDFNLAESKADKLLKDIHPGQSLAIFHAGIAGIYLFLSGVIAGNISNRIKHNRVEFRIKEHPLLKVVLGKKRTERLANFHAKYYPGIMSNLWFGVFMGSTASIGYFVGLNLDIRHITFASGNFALGLFGSDWQISLRMFIWVFLGIGIIGLMNFLVSFTLSVLIAMRSLGMSILHLRYLFSAILLHFRKHPVSFFFPVEIEEEEKALVKEENGKEVNNAD
ncbi:MAG: recombinase [Brumimicrobium sp.]